MRESRSDLPRVTFALPSDYRSGGVRVTMLMGNELLSRGIHCRIACPRNYQPLWKRIRRRYRLWRRHRKKEGGWLHMFNGPVIYYRHLDDLDYQPNEVVIAVGTYMVASVRAMRKPVVKVRFNHGMPTDPLPQYADAWKGSMPTITVSKTLIPRLETESGERVLAVIPNGIDRSDYFPRSDVKRDGIGALYGQHQNKDPKKLIEVLQLAHERWPDVPQYIFSTSPCPPELEHTVYSRLPSVEEASRIYSRSKVWLMTSKTEGLPGVALEAMSCGCVMVSSDNDGSLEIIRHNQNGFIARQPNTEEYLAHIEAVLNDEPLRQRLSSAAIATAEEFTWAKAADKMVHFLQETLPAALAERKKTSASK